MNSNRVISILRQAKAYVERGWCRDRAAAFQIGRITIPVEYDAMFANSFCSLGALARAAEKKDQYLWCRNNPEYQKAMECFARAIGIDPQNWTSKYDQSTPLAQVVSLGIVTPISKWNDDPQRTQQDVIDAYGRAIEIAESEFPERTRAIA